MNCMIWVPNCKSFTTLLWTVCGSILQHLSCVLGVDVLAMLFFNATTYRSIFFTPNISSSLLINYLGRPNNANFLELFSFLFPFVSIVIVETFVEFL